MNHFYFYVNFFGMFMWTKLLSSTVKLSTWVTLLCDLEGFMIDSLFVCSKVQSTSNQLHAKHDIWIGMKTFGNAPPHTQNLRLKLNFNSNCKYRTEFQLGHCSCSSTSDETLFSDCKKTQRSTTVVGVLTTNSCF